MLAELSRAVFLRDTASLNPRLAVNRGWTILRCEHPILDVVVRHATQALRLRFDCTGWDDIPPSIELLDEAGHHLAIVPPCGGILNGGPHPTTGRPFVCMRGSREFHTHPGHLSELWDNYRGKPGNDVLGLLDQLSRAWKRGVA